MPYNSSNQEKYCKRLIAGVSLVGLKGYGVAQLIPNVDFSKIPREYSGYWVVVRLGYEEKVLAQGENPQEALRIAGIDPADSQYVLTQIPEVPTAAWMLSSDSSERS